VQLFRPSALGGTPVGRQFRELLAGPARTADVADLVAFNYVEDVALKQALLRGGGRAAPDQAGERSRPKRTSLPSSSPTCARPPTPK
jgi:hypothetical protein